MSGEKSGSNSARGAGPARPDSASRTRSSTVGGPVRARPGINTKDAAAAAAAGGGDSPAPAGTKAPASAGAPRPSSATAKHRLSKSHHAAPNPTDAKSAAGAASKKTSPAKPVIKRPAGGVAGSAASAAAAAGAGSGIPPKAPASRAGLLGGITGFTKSKLKKTVTIDKSTPNLKLEDDEKAALKPKSRPTTATTTRIPKPSPAKGSGAVTATTKAGVSAGAAAAASGGSTPSVAALKMKNQIESVSSGNVSVAAVLSVADMKLPPVGGAAAGGAGAGADGELSAEAKNAAAGVEVAVKFEGAILFAIDISSSMREKNRWAIATKALRDITTELMARGTMHHFGCMTFNTEMDTLVPISPATPRLVDALCKAMDTTALEGGTAIYKAVVEANRMAKTFCTQHTVQAVTIIVLTDGEDNSSSAAARTDCKATDLYLAKGIGVGAIHGNHVLLKRCVIGLKTGAGARLSKNIGADLLGFKAGGIDVNAVIQTHEQYIAQARAAAFARNKAMREAHEAAERKRKAEEELARLKADAALKAFKDEAERKARAAAQAELERQLKELAEKEAAARAAAEARYAAIKAAAEQAAKLVATPQQDTQVATKHTDSALAHAQHTIDALNKLHSEFVTAQTASALLGVAAMATASIGSGVGLGGSGTGATPTGSPAASPTHRAGAKGGFAFDAKAGNSVKVTPQSSPTRGDHKGNAPGGGAAGASAASSVAAGGRVRGASASGGGGKPDDAASAASTAAKIEADAKKAEEDFAALETALAKANAEVGVYQAEVDDYTANPERGRQTTSYMTPGGLGGRSSIKIETTRMALAKKNLDESKKRRDRLQRQVDALKGRRDAQKKQVDARLAVARAYDALVAHQHVISAFWGTASSSASASTSTPPPAPSSAASSPSAAAHASADATDAATPAATTVLGVRSALAAAMEHLRASLQHSQKSTAKAVATADILKLSATAAGASAESKLALTDADVKEAEAQLAHVDSESKTADRHAHEVDTEAQHMSEVPAVLEPHAGASAALARLTALMEQHRLLAAAHKQAVDALTELNAMAGTGSAGSAAPGVAPAPPLSGPPSVQAMAQGSDEFLQRVRARSASANTAAGSSAAPSPAQSPSPPANS